MVSSESYFEISEMDCPHYSSAKQTLIQVEEKSQITNVKRNCDELSEWDDGCYFKSIFTPKPATTGRIRRPTIMLPRFSLKPNNIKNTQELYKLALPSFFSVQQNKFFQSIPRKKSNILTEVINMKAEIGCPVGKTLKNNHHQPKNYKIEVENKNQFYQQQKKLIFNMPHSNKKIYHKIRRSKIKDQEFQKLWLIKPR